MFARGATIADLERRNSEAKSQKLLSGDRLALICQHSLSVTPLGLRTDQLQADQFVFQTKDSAAVSVFPSMDMNSGTELHATSLLFIQSVGGDIYLDLRFLVKDNCVFSAFNNTGLKSERNAGHIRISSCHTLINDSR